MLIRVVFVLMPQDLNTEASDTLLFQWSVDFLILAPHNCTHSCLHVTVYTVGVFHIIVVSCSVSHSEKGTICHIKATNLQQNGTEVSTGE